MFDENSAKQLILHILQIPIPDQVSDPSLQFVNKFFQKKKKVITPKKSKSLESTQTFSNFMQEIFGNDVSQENCLLPWTSLTIIDLKLKTLILSENDIKAASLFTFYASLNWLTVFEMKSSEKGQKNSPFLPDSSLLDSILTVSSMCKPFVQFSLALYCLIFTRIASIEPIASVKSLEGSACKFLSSVTSTDSQALHLVDWISLINDKIEKNYTKFGSLVINQQLRTVLELVMQAIQLIPTYFNSDDVHKIFQILKPYTTDSCIDPFMLNLTTLMAPFLTTEETDNFFQSGVSALIKYILSIQPFINFDGLNIQFNSCNEQKNEIQNENIKKNESETKINKFNSKNIQVINQKNLFIERGKMNEIHYFVNHENFASSHELIEKIPDDVKSFACLLKQTLEYSSHLNCELFSSQIESLKDNETSSNTLWSILLVLLFMCENSNFEEQSLCEFFNFILNNTSLFKSNYTIFQSESSVIDKEKCNLELFLKLRFYAIRIFISPSQISCFQFYWKSISHRIFINIFNNDECAKFAEFFSFMESIKFSSLISSILPICISDSYFATLNIKDSFLVSSAIYKLIDSVFNQENKDRNMINEFFMNDSFMNFIFTAIFDSYFNDIAMKIVSYCFMRFSEKLSLRFADAFKAIQNEIDVDFFIEKQEEISHHLSVLHRLLEMVIGLILYHSDKASLFNQLFQSSYRSLKYLSSLYTKAAEMQKEICEELHFSLCNVLHSFIKLSSLDSFDENDDLSWTSKRNTITSNSNQSQTVIRMTQTILDEILTMIRSIEGSEPSTPCFSALIFSTASGKSNSLRAEFLISRPSFLALAVRTFASSSRLSGLLKFISSLCDFSTANCRACHVGGIDIELVKILHVNSSSATIVKDVFHLLAQIAQSASSTAAVASYMKCFHCIEEPYKLSPLTEPALSTLDLILARGSQTPAAFLPVMNELPYIRVDELTEGDLFNGFTIVAWIFIDGGSQDSPSNIISIGRENTQQTITSLLTVIVQLGRVFISNGRFLGGKDAIVLEDSVPTDIWTMIAITFENDKVGQRTKSAPEYRIKSFISNRTGTASQKIPIEIGQSRSRPIIVTSCGNVQGGSGLEHPALLASITLFPVLKSHECLEIAQNGLLLTRSNTEGSAVSLETAKKLPAPMFCSVLESENSILCINSTMLKKPKTTKVSLIGRIVVQQMPFADVFTRFFTVKSLLPILAMLALPSKTTCVSERNKSISSCAVSVLFRALQMSPDASRKDFVVSGGFKIVSFLLSRVPECLTSELFIQFAALARESSSEEVRTSTADEIVFNEKLWCLADEKTQFFVVQQCINLAYEGQRGNTNSLQPSRTISSYLATTIYFFLTNLKECSSDLHTLIMNSIIIRSGTNLSAEDVNALFSAASSTDQKITLDMLYIMKQIALMPYSFLNLSDADFFPLNHLFSRGSFSITCSLVRFIIAIHNSRVECHFTLGEHLTMAANEISSSSKKFTAEDSSQIADLVESHPETFQICCAAIAATIENTQQINENNQQSQSLELIFSLVMKSQRNLEVVRDWAFWPFYASLRCGGQSTSSAAKFALKNATDLTELFSQAVVASVTAGDESGIVCREVLLQAGIELLLNRIGGKNQSRKAQTKFSENTYVGLCFYFMFYYGSNKALYKCFEKEGIIDNESYSRELKKPPFKIFTCSHFEKVSLNIDENSNWRDKELALQCVQVIVKRRIIDYANLALFLLLYLMKTLPEPSLTLLQEVKTFAVFEEPFSSLLMTLIKQNVEYPIDNTQLFNFLIDQFYQSSSFVQFSIDSCATRLNKLLYRFNNEEKKRPSPLPFNTKTVENQLKEEQRSARLLWRSLWRQMTFDCAPWNGSLSGSPSPRKWKRDETLCTSCLIPMKMKVNYKFDDHGEASLGRELGNLKLARAKNEETKRQIRQSSLCPELLETGSFDDDEKNKKEEETENDESQSQSVSKSTKIKKSSFTRSFSHGLGFDAATRFFNQESLTPVFSCSCQRVRISKTCDCVFNLFNNLIKLQFKSKTEIIMIHDIARVFLRDPLHHPCGIEIITRQGISYFLVFPEEIKNTDITSAIAHQSPIQVRFFVQTIKSADFFVSHGITKLWCQRKISNFEYLMNLNHYSGRSFSQLSMYPFLPWILVNYESEVLNLNDSSSYRDLSMPVGKLGLQRLESLRKRAREMQQFGNDPFLYSSYAVSPLIVILWMMRVEPFTTLHIDMQSGKFDHASRQFSSIPDSFRMVNTHLNDFRELIPEFFFSKCFLVNENKFDLGVANENTINDVKLPPWSSKNALSFIYINRKALESDHVSDHLNEWIDLIWGFKQRGKEAEEADNTYDPAIYSDIWTEETLNDPERRSLIDQTMTHCGQIPNQLFTAPHPKRQTKINRLNQNTHCTNLFETLQLDGDSILFGTSKDLSESTSSSQKFELVVLRSSGKLVDFLISLNDGNDLSLISSQPLMKGVTLNVEEATSFAMFSFNEIAFGTSSGKVTIVDVKQGLFCSLRPHSGIVNCVAAASPFIVSGGADTVIACSEKVGIDNIQRLHSMPAYSSEVVCAAVSKEFHAVVSGTREGLVIVQSLEKSAVTCVIELREGRKPSHIAVTRSWGFVVVFTSKEVADPVYEALVFTLCGELIGSTITGAKLSKLLTWPSKDGFDFVAAALNDGRIVTFEAFFVSDGFDVVADRKSGLNEGFGCEGNEVVLLSYSIDSGTFVAVTKNGHVSLISNFFVKTDRIL